jgi:hypothetical protein
MNDDIELNEEVQNDGIYNIQSVMKPDGTRDWDLLKQQVYKKYSISDLQEQLLNFYETNLDLSVLTDAGKSTSKISIHFFREVQYRAKNARAKYSPDEVLNSPELLEEAFDKIDSKPDYYNAGSDYKNFVSFITNEATMVSKVAIFSANLARKIYEKYCPTFYANIHDSSAGWGNRCLAAIASKYQYNYFGTDPNSDLQPCYKAQADFVRDTIKSNSNVDIRCHGSEVFVPEWEGKMDLSFTSPPYFNTERYCEESTQSAAMSGGNYYSWRDDFMRPTIKNVYRYLKPGAYYLLNLKNLTPTFGSFPALNDWAIVAQQEGFILENIEVMYYQSSRQFGTSKKTGKKREVKFVGDKEPVLVLKKPINKVERPIIMLYPNTIDKSWENRNKKRKVQ